MGRSPQGEDRLRQKVLEALYRDNPAQNENFTIRSLGELTTEPVRYFVYADVLAELIKAARYRNEGAVALLLGHFSIDEEGPFVEVTAFADLRYLYGGDAVEMLSPAVRSFYRDQLHFDGEMDHGGDEDDGVETDKQSQHIVGVFAAAPGGAAQLDANIARLHLSLFNLPFQLALIIDAETEQIGAYARAPRQAFFNTPFFVVERADVSEIEMTESSNK